MLNFVNTLIVLALALLDLSLVSRIVPLPFAPLFVLPFLIIITMRDRTIYPLVLAAVAGIIYDAAVGSQSFVFTLTFILSALVAKVFFVANQSYHHRRSLILLTLGATVMTLFGSYQVIIADYLNVSLYVSIALYLVFEVILLWGYSHFGAKYFDLIEKTTAERFR